MGGRRPPAPRLGWDQQARHPGKSRKLLGTWDGTWKRWRPKGTETAVLKGWSRDSLRKETRRRQHQTSGSKMCVGWQERKPEEGSERNGQERDEKPQESGRVGPRGRWRSLAPLVRAALAHKQEPQPPAQPAVLTRRAESTPDGR